MYQFNALLGSLGKKTSWDLQLATVAVSHKLENKYHPLAPDPDRAVEAGGKRKNNMDFASFANKAKNLVRR
jgi:hypothetical protein